MSYVDAGYAIALSVLFVYSLGLVARRRRLARAVAAAAAPPATADPPAADPPATAPPREVRA
jgi:hypothetical protein